jgi:hypothetical protein
MIETRIDTDVSFLSLNYDTLTGEFVGNKVFYVTLENTGDETVDNLEVTLTADENIQLTPSIYTAVLGESKRINITLADDVELEEGNYNFKISVNNEYAVEKTVNTNVFASEKNMNNTNEYKLKYFIQRANYRTNIFKLVPYTDTVTPIEINGTVDLTYQEKRELTEPIIPATLNMKLEASIELDLSELNSSDEKTFKVEQEYLGNIVFSGYILPDNSWRSWVENRWTVDVKAICGLASLKSIAFAQQNSTGDNLVNFFGRMSAIEIISNCLQKTDLNLPIYVNCQIMYNGITGWYNILSSIYLSVERYFQNADEPMNCDDVLRSILQIFGCSIVQHKNAWYIYRAKDLVNPNPLTEDNQQLLFSTFFGSTFQSNVLLNFGDVSIGSRINDAEIYHCNENQMLREASTISASQITYQFGGSRNVLANGGIILEGATGINIPGWTVNTSPDGLVDRGVRIGYGYGLRSAVRPLDPVPILIELNQSITVTTGVRTVLRIKFRNDGQNSLYLNFKFGVAGSGGTQWFNISNGQWETGTGALNRVDNYHEVVQGGNSIKYGNLDAIYELETIIPIDGNIVIQINRNGHGPGGLFGVHSVELFPASNGNIKSKDYIARVNNAKSTALKNPVTVYNGDSESDLFVGTIYKSDSDTPTKLWTRYYLDSGLNVQPFYDNKELLEIVSAEPLSMSPRPMTEFEGDFKGYIDFVNFFYMDSFTKPYSGTPGLTVKKQFQFLKWSYSFDDNITKMFSREIEESNLSSNDYNVKIIENFEGESKVTIVS